MTDTRPKFIWHVWFEDAFMAAINAGQVPNLAVVLESFDVSTAAEEAFNFFAVRAIRSTEPLTLILKAQGDSVTAQLYYRVGVKLAPLLTRLEGLTPTDLKLPPAMMPTPSEAS